MISTEVVESMVRWRHDFHRHPELAYREERTAKIVAQTLRELGYEVHEAIAGTGIVAVGRFGNGPSIGLRADMDALPITEETGLAYASSVRGTMHACGHDGHTAMLMGAAAALANRQGLTGTLHFIFQPAEENEGGAKAMIEAGLFRRFDIDAIYGLHNMPGVPVGMFKACPGPMSAAFDTFDITITGTGGHGAFPDKTKDPIVAAAALVTSLNTIVSRAINPLRAAVITVGRISGGETYNVIPDTVTMKGSCRSLDADVRQILEVRVKDMCSGIAAAHGVAIDCRYQHRYPAVVNSAAETQTLIDALGTIATEDEIVTRFEPMMGSEDFAFFLNEKPGCYFMIGNGFEGGNLHSPTYDFNDDVLPIGARAWVALVRHILGGGRRRI